MMGMGGKTLKIIQKYERENKGNIPRLVALPSPRLRKMEPDCFLVFENKLDLRWK